MERLAPEIDLIMNPDIKTFVQAALKLAPAYFWSITSSTSGKHHPPDERGPGGRVLHTKRVARLCAELARTLDIGPEQTDFLLAAAIIHDLVVNGTADEPMPHNWKRHDAAIGTHLQTISGMLTIGAWTAIIATCAVHMGRWASDSQLQPLPGGLGYLLHIADVVASRSWVIVEPL